MNIEQEKINLSKPSEEEQKVRELIKNNEEITKSRIPMTEHEHKHIKFLDKARKQVK